MLPGIGAVMQGVSGGSNVSMSYTDSGSSTADQTNYTFSARAIGAADANRMIIVAAIGRATGARTISSVTVGGISATALATASYSDGGGGSIVGIYYAIVPTGTTADVVINFSSGMARAGCGVWRLTGYSSVTPYDTATATANTTLTLDVDTEPGMAVIGAVYSNPAGVTWTGLTEDFDLSVESNAMSGASAVSSTYGTPRAVSVTGSATSGAAACVVIQ